MEAEHKKQEKSYIKQLIQYPHINEILFIVLVVLCFIGDILGEYSGHFAVFYWLIMIPVFFFITLEPVQDLILRVTFNFLKNGK